MSLINVPTMSDKFRLSLITALGYKRAGQETQTGDKKFKFEKNIKTVRTMRQRSLNKVTLRLL